MFGIKLVLLLALLAIALLCGALPLRRRGAAEAGPNRLLEWGNAAAAGIFLGAGFVHMLPDANAAWEQLGWHYPIGMLLAAAAIVLMLLFEHVLPPEDAHHAMHAPSADRFGARSARARRRARCTRSSPRSRSTRCSRGWRSARSASCAARS